MLFSAFFINSVGSYHHQPRRPGRAASLLPNSFLQIIYFFKSASFDFSSSLNVFLSPEWWARR
jgi:hypothetical protein